MDIRFIGNLATVCCIIIVISLGYLVYNSACVHMQSNYDIKVLAHSTNLSQSEIQAYKDLIQKIADDQENTTTLLAMQTGIFTLIVILFLGLTGFLLNNSYQKDIEKSEKKISDDNMKLEARIQELVQNSVKEIRQE